MVFSFVRRAFDWITQKFPTKTISRKMANVYNLEWGNYAAKGTTENDEIIPRVLFLIDSICIQVWDWVGASARWWAMAVAHVSHRYDLINTVIINSSPCSYFSSLFFLLLLLVLFLVGRVETFFYTIDWPLTPSDIPLVLKKKKQWNKKVYRLVISSDDAARHLRK